MCSCVACECISQFLTRCSRVLHGLLKLLLVLSSVPRNGQEPCQATSLWLFVPVQAFFFFLTLLFKRRKCEVKLTEYGQAVIFVVSFDTSGLHLPAVMFCGRASRRAGVLCARCLSLRTASTRTHSSQQVLLQPPKECLDMS